MTRARRRRAGRGRRRGHGTRVAAVSRALTQRVTIARWIIVLLSVAVVVLCAYLVLSQRRKSARVDLRAMPPIGEAMDVIAGLSGGTVYAGNAVQTFPDGAFFDAVERDVAAATRSVHVESFIWGDGAIPDRMGRDLAAAAHRGVAVRLLVDAFGSRYADEDKLEALRREGVRVFEYKTLRLRNAHSQNYRDHRKIVVVDGTIAYVMGHGISDEWAGHGEDAKHWRDESVRIEGPAVTRLQALFAENWLETSGEAFVQPADFAPQPAAGTAQVAVAASASGDQLSNVGLLMESAIDASRESLDIAMAYFAPSDHVLDAIERAARRGVRVRLLVPGRVTDSAPVRHAGHAHDERLLRAGVRIFEHQATMIHQKVIIVDGRWSHVGSTNLDLRSLEMSEEVSVGILDDAVAADLERRFEHDLTNAKETTLADVRRRGLLHRAVDWCSRALREQL